MRYKTFALDPCWTVSEESYHLVSAPAAAIILSQHDWKRREMSPYCYDSEFNNWYCLNLHNWNITCSYFYIHIVAGKTFHDFSVSPTFFFLALDVF